MAVGVSYRVVLTDSTGGTTYWDIDPVTAVPSSAGNLDITATAGEALSLGDCAYLSDGSGSLTAGRWYQCDADNAYEASTAGLVGLATAAIASAGTGTVRIAGRMTGLSSLTTGEFYYASATAGALTATPPANQRFIGQADSTTTLVIGGTAASAVVFPDSDGTHRFALLTTANLTDDRRVTVDIGDSNRAITLNGDPTLGSNDTSPSGQPTFNRPMVPQGRCTLTSGTAVTTTDVTAATTIYYTPYDGSQIALYDSGGSGRWTTRTLAEISIAVPATTNTMYDVFVYDNAGTPTLELTAWTNGTTRATALTTQNGMYVRTGAASRLYVCSFRTTGVSGQTENSFAKRFLFNHFHRFPLLGRNALETANEWTYTTATIRQANANAANQCEFIVGLAGVRFSGTVVAAAANSGAGVSFYVGIGLDSTSEFTSGGHRQLGQSIAANQPIPLVSTLVTYPAVGYHYASWNEYSTATNTTTWYGDANTPTLSQSGISCETQG